MAGAAGVLLDAVDELRARVEAVEVDGTDAAAVATTAVAHGHAPAVVAPALCVPDFDKGEGPVGPVFPNVVLDGPLEVAETGGARLVGAPVSPIISSPIYIVPSL